MSEIKFISSKFLKPLLVVLENGNYAGAYYDEKGKDWCDGFYEGVKMMQAYQQKLNSPFKGN